MTTLNLKEMSITTIQFFDYSHQVEVSEDEFETVQEYSANIIFDEKFVVQLSGCRDEAHRPLVPSSAECYYNDEDLQDEMQQNLDIDDVIEALAFHKVENNFDYLSENGESF